MSNMDISDITSQEMFNTFIKTNKSCVIHFYAPWADQCSQMHQVIESMSKSKEYQEIKFGKVVAENIPHLSIEYKISAVPTIILFSQGTNKARVDGANPAGLADKIKTYLLDSEENSQSEGKDNENLETRLKKLINQSPCMLFMKGNKENPRCGFSKQIILLLDKYNAKYETFDILMDNEVREGLKEYSKWPTYPQLYIDGEFIGGLDIVTEMIGTGELDKILPKKTTITLEDRLQKLINQSPCMLFMKGNKNNPRCGFSKSMIMLLNEQKVNYETFDILEDNEVREGLKKYSNWPTYPQLYINSELIGGLDIVKEMIKSGEFSELLNS